MYQSLWNTDKEVLTRKYIVPNAYILKTAGAPGWLSQNTSDP